MSRSDLMESTSHQYTRISAACSICRAKKRKCSGEKPVCAECKSLDLPCEWPKQLKRGPAKHYVRILEARLRRTEALLRNILPFVSDEQLLFVLRENGPLATLRGSSGAVDAQAANSDRWQLYPLATPKDIRAWQSDSMTPNSPLPLPGQDDDRSHHSRGPGISADPMTSPNGAAMPDLSSSSSQRQSGGDQQLHTERRPDTPGNSDPDRFAAPSTLPTASFAAPSPPSERRMGLNGGTNSSQHKRGETASEEPLSDSFLPLSFQKEFLW